MTYDRFKFVHKQTILESEVLASETCREAAGWPDTEREGERERERESEQCMWRMHMCTHSQSVLLACVHEWYRRTYGRTPRGYLSIYIYICLSIYLSLSLYIYIYTYREREREKCVHICVYRYIYLYIYIYIYCSRLARLWEGRRGEGRGARPPARAEATKAYNKCNTKNKYIINTKRTYITITIPKGNI